MAQENLSYEQAYELYKEKKYIEVFSDLEYLADVKDNPNAQTLIANMYLTGNGTAKKLEKAFEYYKKATIQGNVSAQFNLAMMYETGKGVEQDYFYAITNYKEITNKHPKAGEKVKALYEKFKEQSNNSEPDSFVNIGLLFEFGVGFKQSFEQALTYYKKAAALDHPRGYYAIAMLYYHGDGVEQSYEKALAYLNKAVVKRHAPSLYAVGLMYIKGLGVTQNEENGLKYIKHAAVQNYAPAYNAIGLIFSEKNPDLAITYFMKSAEFGNISALHSLGILCSKSKNDQEKSLAYFSKAAKAGHLKSQKILAKYYNEGENVNVQKAAEWFLKAANQNDQESKRILNDVKFQKYI